MKKVFTMVMVALMVTAAFAVTAFAADWTEFGTDESNNSVTDAETPTSEDEAELVFKATVKDSTSWDANSNVICVGDYLYVGNGNEIIKLDKAGNETAKATLTASMSSFAPFIAYDNGTLYVYVNDMTDGYIEAIDAATMQRVWVSEKIAGMNGFSPITISGGSLFVAVSGYDWTGYAPTPGYLIGMTTTDDNEASQDEVKTNTFVYDGSQTYYWNGAAISGSAAIVGSQEGNIQTVNTTTGALIDTLAIGSVVKSTVTYHDGKVYFGLETGIASVDVASDGIIDDTSLIVTPLGGQVTTTPVVSGGRVYVGTGDFSGGMGFFVLDAATLAEAYRAEISGVDSFSGADIPISGVQSTPVLTTAYDSTYVYFAINAKPGGVSILKDSAGQTTADVTTIFTPEAADQNATSAAFVAGEDGTLYYTNDSGYLFAIGKAEPEPTPTPTPTATPTPTPTPTPSPTLSGQITNPQTGQNGGGWILLAAVAVMIIAAIGFMLSRREHTAK